MAEEKILIPTYKRMGNCGQCGEAVYAPDIKQNGGWPLMSACACLHGPQMAGHAELQSRRRTADLKPAEQAQAA